MLLRGPVLGVLLLAGLISGVARAQTVAAGPDSAVVATPSVPDSSRRTERLLGWRVTRPQKAALLSAMLPGAGQVYNRKYWKLPLVYGGLGLTLGTEILYQQRYREFTKGYQARTDGDPATVDEGTRSSQIATAAGVYRGLTFYRRERDKWIAFTAVAYTLNIVDALVDAHLRDFDLSDDLSLRWQPALLGNPATGYAPGASLSFHLKATHP